MGDLHTLHNPRGGEIESELTLVGPFAVEMDIFEEKSPNLTPLSWR
jgi:hypothetical protein